jgi:proteic killer suppression protein
LIASFGDAATADLFHGRKTARVRRFPTDVVRVALRKMDAVNAAAKLDDLKAPPGNRLEALKKGLAGMHSIRVNDQWRLVFRWAEGKVEALSLADYHG